MRRQTDSLTLESEDNSIHESDGGFTCDTCGETYQKPLFATVSSSGNTQTYLACPRCMVKVGSAKPEKDIQETESSIVTKSSEKKALISHDKNFQCKHFLGYLKKRSKETPIPDECLTCGRMIECMVH